MTRISILTILCQCESHIELVRTAKEFGCVDIHVLYSAVHLMLPDGTRGSFRLGTAGFVWCAADSAE